MSKCRLIRKSSSSFEVKGVGPVSYGLSVTPNTKFLHLCDSISRAGITWEDFGRVMCVLSVPDNDRTWVAKKVGLDYHHNDHLALVDESPDSQGGLPD